jgi:flagellar protein FlaG
MDSTIVAVDKPTSVKTAERQVEPQPKAGEVQAGSKGASDRSAMTPENADTTVQAAVESAIERNGEEIRFGGRSIQFTYDRDMELVIVKVKNMDSGELIRQIPPDEFLKFASRFRELMGVLFDETA